MRFKGMSLGSSYAGQSELTAIPVAGSGHEAVASAPVTRRLPWRNIIKQAFLMWLVTRLVYVVLTYCALVAVTPTHPLSLHAMVAAWDNWDTVWYTRIAVERYNTGFSSAFFPLYPILIALVSFIIGRSHVVVAALIVSNLSTLSAFIGMGALAYNEDGTEESAGRTIRMVAAFPLALFLTAGYTEGLFLTFVAFNLFALRRGYWFWAAAMAFLAALTRSTAVILLPPMLWEYGRQHGWWRREVWQPRNWRLGNIFPLRFQRRSLLGLIAMVAAIPFAMLLYELYLWRRFSDPFIISHVESFNWGRHVWPVWQTLYEAFGFLFRQAPWSYYQATSIIDLTTVFLVIIITCLMIRRVPVVFTIYMVSLILLVLMTPTDRYNILSSARRYMLPAAPMYIQLGRWTVNRQWLDLLITSGGFVLQGIFTYAFLHNTWAG